MKKGLYNTSSDNISAAMQRWEVMLAGLDVAFQAVVNAHTGRCFGCEVLLRGHEGFGFRSVGAWLDASHAAGMLAEVEIAVRRKAAAKLTACGASKELALFFNLDRRMLPAVREFHKAVRKVLNDHAAHVVTEIEDRWEAGPPADWVMPLKKHGSLIAVDRFGEGIDSLRLLHEADPDFLKIPPYFVDGIGADARKRVVLSQVVAMAHTLGMLVIAVGVETQQDFQVCRELGCDMVQGFFIQPPVADPGLLTQSLAHVERVDSGGGRRRIDQKWILDQLDAVTPVEIESSMSIIFDRLAHDAGHTLIPVVDSLGQPLGIVRERNLKNYAYSTFGKDLIANKGIGRSLRDFLVRCPIAEITTSLDQILAIFSTDEEADGIIMASQMRYVGFLSARSIIRAIHEKTLAHAREENPLTKLPGNDQINDYTASCVAGGDGVVLAYVDFDNFKPFNDTYGFRQGDRAILLFAELMRKAAVPQTWFVGHIGGDDFFIGIQGSDLEEVSNAIGTLIQRFASDAVSFYDTAARERGSIIAQDREGNIKIFPLLSASAVLIEVPPGCTTCTIDDVSAAIACQKKAAKSSPTKLAVASLDCRSPR